MNPRELLTGLPDPLGDDGDRSATSGHGDASDGLDRRSFLGGVGSLLAAAAFSREVPDAVAAQVDNSNDSDTQTVTSPDGSVSVTVDVSSGVPTYDVTFDGTTVVQSSALGFEFANQPTFGAAGDGGSGATVTVTGAETGTKTENWDPVWDQYDQVSADYELLRLGLAETSSPGRSANLEFRVFDDGLGFRVAFDGDFDSFAITAETTEFNFGGDYDAWWIPNAFTQPRFEDNYRETTLSEVPGGTRTESPNGNTVRKGAHTPFTLRADDSTYLSVHEADLTDYATMSVAPQSDGGGTDFAAELAPLPNANKVEAAAPHVTPWRTVQLGRSPGDLVESSLVPLLNDDIDTSVLPTDGSGNPDTAWITPKKYVGIWWLMIAGSAKWEYRTDSEVRNDDEVTDDPRKYIHGAQTGRMKRYLKFASENDIGSVLVEGWNKGWDSYTYKTTDGSTMDFDATYPDFDLDAVTSYGQSLSPPAEMTAHTETSGNVATFEDQITNDGIFATYESRGIRSLKTGYVSDPGLGIDGDGTSATHNHHCQLAVNHHELVAREAAKHRIMLEIHEGVKPTGRRRTYPNLTTREVVKAQEYDGFGALGSTVPRNHHVTLPFTRMLGGPMSYQAGLFDVTFNDSTGGQAQATRAKQLAMYPNFFSGLQMVADRIEAYVDPTLSVGELVQAEAGDLEGTITADVWRGAQGAHYVPLDPNREPSGASVSFTVTGVAAAGEYDLHLRYASDAEQNAQRVTDNGSPQFTLSVNGSTTTVQPGFTNDWDDWQTFTTTVTLDAGDNDVALQVDYDDSGGFTGDVGGLNVDAVAVTQPGDPFPATPANENFDTEPEFEFVRDVPADWDDTTVVDASIGEYAVTARRKGTDWFVGAMTDGSGRAVEVPLDFLSAQSSGWKLELYTDGADTTIDRNQTDVRVSTATVSAGDTVLASMPPGGGTAFRLTPATSEEASSLPGYTTPSQTIDVRIDGTTDVESTFISATGSNGTDYIGGTNLVVRIDGSVVSERNVRLPPGASGTTIPVEETISDPGTYDVSVERGDGTVLASRTVTVQAARTVGTFADPTGDDDGPGGYTYPTNAAFADGCFELESFAVEKTADAYRFTFEAETLNNGFGSGRGFSPHMFVLWLRDPEKSGGSTTPVDGSAAIAPNAEFAAGWHYRLRVDGFNLDAVDENGAALTDADGNPVDPTVGVDTDAGTVSLTVPRAAFDGADVFEMEALPALGSEDRGTLRPVVETATEYKFGGADPDAVENTPRLVDVVTPSGTTQAEALAYSADERAQVPFTPIHEAELPGASHVATFADGTGDDDGWGPVSYPAAGVHGDPGSLDVERLGVYETADRYQFVAHFAEQFDNPAGKAAGFTRPHLRLYLRDPSQGGTTTKGGIGCHPYGNKQILEDAGWHRIVDVQADYKAVQDTSFSPLATTDVRREVTASNDAIVVGFPKDLLPAPVRDLDLTLLVFPWQSNTSGIMKIEEQQYAATNEAGETVDVYRPNTSSSNYYHTNVVDMLSPSGVDQASVLDPATIQNSGKSGDQSFSEYQIPLLSVGDRANGVREALAGAGPVTEADFEALKRAYDRNEPLPGTGGLVPTYRDLRAIGSEVTDG